MNVSIPVLSIIGRLARLHVDYNKVYACNGLNIFKNTPLKFFKREGGGCSLALDPPLTKH